MFTKASADDLRAVLSAYRLVKNSSWRELHPAMDRRAPYWASSSEADLATELTEYLKESIAPGCAVRVFWKLGPKLLFSGCNEHFASDAGVPSSELMGMDDFDDRLPWKPQASKYRADDAEVVQSARPKLDILERQKSPSGDVIWTRVGKAPVMGAAGTAIGILGLYETVDAKTASALFMARQSPKS
jgi:hypothetical protein